MTITQKSHARHASISKACVTRKNLERIEYYILPKWIWRHAWPFCMLNRRHAWRHPSHASLIHVTHVVIEKWGTEKFRHRPKNVTRLSPNFNAREHLKNHRTDFLRRLQESCQCLHKMMKITTLINATMNIYIYMKTATCCSCRTTQRCTKTIYTKKTKFTISHFFVKIRMFEICYLWKIC